MAEAKAPYEKYLALAPNSELQERTRRQGKTEVAAIAG